MIRLSRVRMSGPLEPYRRGFTAELKRQGYANGAARALLYAMAHLSLWLDERGLDAGDLTSDRVEHFVAARRSSGYVQPRTSRGMNPLLGYLRGLRVAPDLLPPVASTSGARLVQEFTEYLLQQRGFAAHTVTGRRKVAWAFLARRSEAEILGLEAAEVSAFVLAESKRLRASSLNTVATALRSLLSFLHVHGYTTRALMGAVPRAAVRQDAPQPALGADEVKRLLASCDRRTTDGRRDYALLTLLVRLGLRSGEVATLSVDDVHWRAGEIVVLGKGGARERLPLPDDVGRALSTYCRRGRRRGGDRHLFLRVQAPYCGLSPDAISAVVRRACRRIGLPAVGAHQLRYTAAVTLRRAGAPLAEISQLLRHRCLATTARYAQEDLAALAGVVRPWPGGVT